MTFRLLRNSFSKLRPRGSYLHTKSKSADVLKKPHEDYDDDDEEKENVDVVSPIEQEMVIASMRAGLPIIPFPMPNLVITNNNLEETKTIIRENSLKDIKFPQPTGGSEVKQFFLLFTKTFFSMIKVSLNGSYILECALNTNPPADITLLT